MLSGTSRLMTVLLLALLTVKMAVAELPTAETLLGIKDDPNSPVALTVTLKNCGLKEGVCLRSEIENKGTVSRILQVCPEMYLCCVKDLHLLVSFDNTGMGLVDLCKQQQPTPHEVFLPPQASFAFDVRIPAERLPKAAMEANKKITLVLCYAYGEGKLVHSNVVQAELK